MLMRMSVVVVVVVVDGRDGEGGRGVRRRGRGGDECGADRSGAWNEGLGLAVKVGRLDNEGGRKRGSVFCRRGRRLGGAWRRRRGELGGRRRGRLFGW